MDKNQVIKIEQLLRYFPGLSRRRAPKQALFHNDRVFSREIAKTAKKHMCLSTF